MSQDEDTEILKKGQGAMGKLKAVDAIKNASSQARRDDNEIQLSQDMLRIHAEEVKISIDFKELRRLITFIFKLSLETSTEILLDYDLEKLADAVAKGAFTFN